MKTCKEILNETQNHVTTCKNGTHTAYRVLMCSELDLTSTLASLRLVKKLVIGKKVTVK